MKIHLVHEHHEGYGAPALDTGDAHVVITDAFVGPIIRTAEGNEYGICLRDDTIEITPVGGAPAPRVWANEPAEPRGWKNEVG